MNRPSRYLLFLPLLLTYVCACQSQTPDGAQSSPAAKIASQPSFDKNQAFTYLTEQCAFGPRYPGSPGHAQTRDYLTTELRKFTERVRVQSFSAVNFMENKRAQAANIIASFGSGPTQLVLCAHWDSRPRADQDPEPANQTEPVIGANDAASGVAVLLEMARNFSINPPPVAVDIVLFDAEDMGRASHADEFLQGSRFFAKNKAFNYNPQAAILLDMVGDSDLQIYVEGNSNQYAPDLVNRVWSKAEELGISEFYRDVRHTVTDDHLPLLQVGIPAIDIIDYDYPAWHTVADTPDKCSPESLEKIGRVLLALVYE